MFAKTATTALFALALARRTHAASSTDPTATVDLFPVGFEDDGLQGEIVGTGTDGTTYVLSGTFEPTSDAVPYTLTLVEDATHVTMVASIAIASGATLGVNAECSIPADAAALGEGAVGACTEVIDAAGSATTGVISGGVQLTPVAVAAGTFSVATGSVNATHSVSTLSVSGGSGGATTTTGAPSATGVLGPTISVGTSTNAQGSTGLVVGSSATLASPTQSGGSSSGALPLRVVAAGMLLGVVAPALAGAAVLLEFL